MEEQHQVPIWFFIGAMLLVYGILITGSGIYGWISPPKHKVALWDLHADVWWGILMIVVGAFYSRRFCPFCQAQPEVPAQK